MRAKSSYRLISRFDGLGQVIGKALGVPLLVLLMIAPAAAEDLKVYAAAALKAPLVELAAAFEAQTGRKVVFVFDTAGAAEQGFLADAQAAFLVTSDVLIQNGQRSGALNSGTTHRLGETLAGLAAPPGSTKPDISTAEKLKAALLGAKTVAFSDPARGATVGAHFIKVIESLGIKDEVLRKSTLARDGAETMRLVLEKKASLGVTQISEIVQADTAAVVGPFPGEFSLATGYSLWYGSNAASAARDFVNQIISSSGRQILAASGFRN